MPEWIRAAAVLAYIGLGLWTSFYLVWLGRLPRSPLVAMVMKFNVGVIVAVIFLGLTTGIRPFAIWPEANDYLAHAADALEAANSPRDTSLPAR